MKIAVWVICFVLLIQAFCYRAWASDLEWARTAAPAHITDDANYMVWNGKEYVVEKVGKNGFFCLVLRDAKGRFEPTCFNPAAMQSIFPVYSFQTLMLEKGVSIEKIHKSIAAKYLAKEFVDPEPGTIVYMMSPENKFYDYFSNQLVDVAPHIMLYTPKLDQTALGLTGAFGLPGYYDEYPHLGVIHVLTSSEVRKSRGDELAH